MQKTIIITISRAFIIRNVLRSGGYKFMKEAGFRLVVLFPIDEVPQYLHDEFNDGSTTLIAVKEKRKGKLHRIIFKLTSSVVFTDSTRRYLKYGNARYIQRKRVWAYVHIVLVWFLSRVPLLKPLLRKLDFLFDETNDDVKQIFDEYNPDIVFGTSIATQFDISIMKEGRRRGITTVAMPKGWDNVTRDYYRFVPDYMIIQNDTLKRALVTIQHFNPENIFVTGFPQFDWYRKEGIIVSREEHFKKFELDPERPLIFFGSEGVWGNSDHQVAEHIAGWVERDELVKPAQMLVRPHFTNIKEGYFLKFKGRKNVALDETLRISDQFMDNWDPGVEETMELVNTLYHADMLVTTISTLNLDAVSFDKPLINLRFGAKHRGNEDITPYLYHSNHMQWVLETGALRLVDSKEELKAAINLTLEGKEGEGEAEGRQRLRDGFCFKIDGQSSKRMVEALTHIAEKI